MNLRKQPGVLRFVGVARKYCALLEAPANDREEWLQRVQSALASLYAAAFGLPEVSLENDDRVVPDSFHMTHEEWFAFWNLLGDLLGEARYHWAYFDPTEPRGSQEKPIIHDLADDLADIHRNVRSGLRAWDANEGYATHAIWNWQFDFQHHWGPHAVSALRALHNLVYFRGLPPSDTKADNA